MGEPGGGPARSALLAPVRALVRELAAPLPGTTRWEAAEAVLARSSVSHPLLEIDPFARLEGTGSRGARKGRGPLEEVRGAPSRAGSLPAGGAPGAPSAASGWPNSRLRSDAAPGGGSGRVPEDGRERGARPGAAPIPAGSSSPIPTPGRTSPASAENLQPMTGERLAGALPLRPGAGAYEVGRAGEDPTRSTSAGMLSTGPTTRSRTAGRLGAGSAPESMSGMPAAAGPGATPQLAAPTAERLESALRSFERLFATLAAADAAPGAGTRQTSGSGDTEPHRPAPEPARRADSLRGAPGGAIQRSRAQRAVDALSRASDPAPTASIPGIVTHGGAVPGRAPGTLARRPRLDADASRAAPARDQDGAYGVAGADRPFEQGPRTRAPGSTSSPSTAILSARARLPVPRRSPLADLGSGAHPLAALLGTTAPPPAPSGRGVADESAGALPALARIDALCGKLLQRAPGRKQQGAASGAPIPSTASIPPDPRQQPPLSAPSPARRLAPERIVRRPGDPAPSIPAPLFSAATNRGADLEADAVADLVNEALVEQARHHGVELR